MLVAVLDILKGYVPVLGFEAVRAARAPRSSAGLAAVLGHLTSPLLRGKGGKGVATSLGAVLAVQPLWAIPVLVVFAGASWPSRGGSGSRRSPAALMLVPAALWFDDPPSDIVFAGLLTVIVAFRHRKNLQAVVTRT